MFINFVFCIGSDRPSGFLSFVPILRLSILTPLFLHFLPYFNLAVPMRECLGKYPRTSSPFPIVILNGTSFFLSLV